MLQRLRTYSRFVKIEHSVFALPLVFAGLILGAGGWPVGIPFNVLLYVAIAAIGARTAAFALNRIFDSKIDALNPRTAQRELPSKAMSLQEAIVVGMAGAAIYFYADFLIMGPLGIVFGFVPILIFAVYPFMKRFTALAHFGVGLSLALAPVAGWLVIAERTGILTYLGAHVDQRKVLYSIEQIPFLFFFTFFWVSGFDIIYATMDETFDRNQGLHSLPAKFGRKKALWISAALHGLAFVTLLLLYVSYFRTPAAGVLLGAAGVLLFLEQYLAENVDLAFFKINAVLSFVVLAFIWTGVKQV